jgi:GNAT superfamily N-acetyltransferase
LQAAGTYLTGMSVMIRELPRGERARLAPLLSAYAAEMRGTLAGGAVAPAEAQAALLASHPAAEVLVAEQDGEPVGFAILFDLPEVVFARRCGMLDDLFVLPAARGRGIARALIAEAVSLGRARGWSHLRWIVPEGDAGAIALYERIAERADWRSYVVRIDPAASL